MPIKSELLPEMFEHLPASLLHSLIFRHGKVPVRKYYRTLDLRLASIV